MIANFFNFFTPSNLGGDAYRLTSFRALDTGTDKLLLLVAFERMLALILWLMLVVCVLLIDATIDGQLLDAVTYAFEDLTLLFLLGVVAIALFLSAVIVFCFLSKFRKMFNLFKRSLVNTFAIITARNFILIVTLTLISIFGWAATCKFVGDFLAVHLWLTHLAADSNIRRASKASANRRARYRSERREPSFSSVCSSVLLPRTFFLLPVLAI